MEGSSKNNKRKKIDEHMKKNKKRHVINNSINLNPEEKKICERTEKYGQESFGVFEFPWMKDSMISTSLDWSLPGSPFPFIDDGNEMFEGSSELRLPVKRFSNDMLEFEAFEFIWTSISD
ncbi:unnamed protein product [Brassica rapa]|uniref:Uncharacterized protein n=1 Tax=Brassica campestris TaxID=3711 RepID=A0A8D9DA87_BRACM|nr:unnamed protein product [Brassica rapa]